MGKIAITSKSEANKEFAKKYKVWQQNNTFNVKSGDVCYIHVSGSKEHEYLGVVEKTGYEPRLAWPDGWQGEARSETPFTIRFRDISNDDFKMSQQAIWYEK